MQRNRCASLFSPASLVIPALVKKNNKIQYLGTDIALYRCIGPSLISTDSSAYAKELALGKLCVGDFGGKEKI